MTRQRLNLSEGDLLVLARALDIDGDSLRDELDRRPWYANDVLRRPEVVDSVLHGTGVEQFTVSPLLFFAVLIHRAAEELQSTDWVNEWAGPGCRLPVFDVEPLVEFADAPARLQFTAQLLASFAVPEAAPVPADRLDLDELVDWLGAVEPTDHIVLLRQLGDLALFRAGVFPDSDRIQGALVCPGRAPRSVGADDRRRAESTRRSWLGDTRPRCARDAELRVVSRCCRELAVCAGAVARHRLPHPCGTTFPELRGRSLPAPRPAELGARVLAPPTHCDER